MNGDGVQRLHFFDGQRLQATDLRVEQRYHMSQRRLLNRGLFGPGAVVGLEVTKVDDHTVEVSPGLALDPEGREVVLGEPQPLRRLRVPNRPPTLSVGGYFLTIHYQEVPLPGSVDGCREPAGGPQPARILERPLLGWTETWPNHRLCGQPGHPEDCAIVLAKVSLDSSCAIAGIDAGSRQWAQVIVPGQVHAFALEGGRDIDVQHPGRLRFHVRGGRPSAVILYLRAEPFTPYYYTELGSHIHSLENRSTAPVSMPDHAHRISNAPTTLPSELHDHNLTVALPGLPITTALAVPISSRDQIDLDGAHLHFVTATTGNPLAGALAHAHGLQGNVAATGAADVTARTDLAYTYVDHMVVKLDDHPITDLITGSPRNWPGLGDGTAASPFAQLGTGPIDLIALGLTIEEGEHVLEFRVPAGGGRVAYNLYVE
jgi:hypothetical protein